MPRFAVRHEHVGPWPALSLVDTVTGGTATIAHRGARVLHLRVPLADGLYDVADGYADVDTLTALKSARFAVMLPFANRIADGRYRFDGEDFDLQPGVEGSARGIRHGFVLDTAFDVAATGTGDDGASVRFEHVLRPDMHPGYPFALDLAVTYTLHAGGLDLDVRMRNTGTRKAPCFFGWHPYLRLRDDGVDALELQLPATQRVRTDADLIPLPGAAAYADLEAWPGFDFRRPRPIGHNVLDTAFAGLAADSDGRIRSHLRDPDSGLAVAMWQERGVALAFSGDTLAADARRRSLALEPMEALTNAFNRDDCVEAITLAPGAERHFRCGLEIHLP
ncbi:MAG TPA: aldose epimerase [Rhodanobacteraceae bacterium]|nr:aldose epimerase [Rhodanobacteraceae bacterium]